MITDYRDGARHETLGTRTILHRLHPRRTGTGPVHRRDHHADLSDVDLRAGGARPAQGLRVRAHAESDAQRRSKRISRRSKAARAAFAFASGMSAISAIVARLATGDHVIVTDNTYGGTFRLFDKVLTRYGLTFSYVDTSDLGADRARVHAADEAGVRRDADQPGAAAHRHRGRRRDRAPPRRAPRRRQHVREPVPAAAARARRRPRHAQHDEVPERPQRFDRRRRRSPRATTTSSGCKFIQNSAGAILSPFDSWLVLRGTKTLPLRMAQHSANGLALAEFLERHPKVTRVYLSGPAEPSAARARPAADAERLRRHAVVRGGDARATRAVLNRFKLMSLAESLGGVETLVCHPASMTHASVPPERRAAIGLTDSMIRISAGHRGHRGSERRSGAGARSDASPGD